MTEDELYDLKNRVKRKKQAKKDKNNKSKYSVLDRHRVKKCNEHNEKDQLNKNKLDINHKDYDEDFALYCKRFKFN